MIATGTRVETFAGLGTVVGTDHRDRLLVRLDRARRGEEPLTIGREDVVAL